MPRIRPLIALAALGLVFSPTTASIALAETQKGTSMKSATLSAQSVATVIRTVMPVGYDEVARRPATLDGQGAELVRYERTDGRNAALGGEHFSTVIAADGRLKGFARIDLALVGGQLPTREETQAIAIDFLRDAAPDLLPVLKISWIDPYDEPLRVARNGRTEDLTLTGMKVKCGIRPMASGCGSSSARTARSWCSSAISTGSHSRAIAARKSGFDSWLVENGHDVDRG